MKLKIKSLEMLDKLNLFENVIEFDKINEILLNTANNYIMNFTNEMKRNPECHMEDNFVDNIMKRLFKENGGILKARYFNGTCYDFLNSKLTETTDLASKEGKIHNYEFNILEDIFLSILSNSDFNEIDNSNHHIDKLLFTSIFKTICEDITSKKMVSSYLAGLFEKGICCMSQLIIENNHIEEKLIGNKGKSPQQCILDEFNEFKMVINHNKIPLVSNYVSPTINHYLNSDKKYDNAIRFLTYAHFIDLIILLNGYKILKFMNSFLINFYIYNSFIDVKMMEYKSIIKDGDTLFNTNTISTICYYSTTTAFLLNSKLNEINYRIKLMGTNEIIIPRFRVIYDYNVWYENMEFFVSQIKQDFQPFIFIDFLKNV